jgi:decaprenylphospho-beta-D-ribofuranose 2-oxidase
MTEPAPPNPKPLPFMEWTELKSLIGSMRTHSLVARPTTIEQCREVLAWCREHGQTICVRGSGRGYGDLALNDGHVVLDMSGMNRILEIDEESAQITVESGTRLIEIFERVHHRLLTLPASPTESHSSVAGAICANVNGKDAWRRGSFGDQVVRLTLLTGEGKTIEIDRSHELFPGVVGGLGLLGVIVTVTLQLCPIPSPVVEINRIPAPDVDALLGTMADIEQSCDAAVVWVDAYARGRRAGRSVVHTAQWIEHEETEPQRRESLQKGFRRLVRHRKFGLALHETFGPLISLMLYLQRPAVHAFNRLYYALCVRAARRGKASNTELFLRFNFEASFTVPPAHLVCGPRGYTVQLTFPRAGAREAILEMLEICRSSPCPPVTTILRAHRADDYLISFSEDGYSLNFEFHPKKRQEAASREAVDRLIDATARRGGKVHLAKDQVLRPDQFLRIYPRCRELLAMKRQLDPNDLFNSDLARRVGLELESGGEEGDADAAYPVVETSGAAVRNR